MHTLLCQSRPVIVSRSAMRSCWHRNKATQFLLSLKQEMPNATSGPQSSPSGMRAHVPVCKQYACHDRNLNLLQGEHALAMRCFLQISAQAAFAFLETALSSTRGSTEELQSAVENMVRVSTSTSYQPRIAEKTVELLHLPPIPLPMTSYSCRAY